MCIPDSPSQKIYSRWEKVTLEEDPLARPESVGRRCHQRWDRWTLPCEDSEKGLEPPGSPAGDVTRAQPPWGHPAQELASVVCSDTPPPKTPSRIFPLPVPLGLATHAHLLFQPPLPGPSGSTGHLHCPCWGLVSATPGQTLARWRAPSGLPPHFFHP